MLRPFPSCIRPSPIPRRNRSVPVSLTSRSVSAFPDFRAGRLPHCPFRGLLGVHYALRPVRSLSRPRRPFVTGVLRPMSLPPSSAPTATGWSDSCRAGFAPAEEWRLLTAHPKLRPNRPHELFPCGRFLGPESRFPELVPGRSIPLLRRGLVLRDWCPVVLVAQPFLELPVHQVVGLRCSSEIGDEDGWRGRGTRFRAVTGLQTVVEVVRRRTGRSLCVSTYRHDRVLRKDDRRHAG